jgi:hypothetical protein
MPEMPEMPDYGIPGTAISVKDPATFHGSDAHLRW